ncbi:MAG TPA: adenylate/guanylate cyclase domain-containing protein [Candidatus Binataceae bacterium]|nr:adenylate/guanylate cyclase domain-containing protein [Candidatus Binataceae bacterium]
MAGRTTSQFRTRLTTISIGLATIVAVSFVQSHYPKVFEWTELTASDLRVYRGAPPKPTGRVVVGTIDDKSIAEFGRFPWPRSVEARLVDALRDYKAAVVGFDIAFSERDPADVAQDEISRRLEASGVNDHAVHTALGGSNDRAFARAIEAQGSTYLGYFFSSHVLHEETGAEMSSFRTKFIEPPPLAYNMTTMAPGAQRAYVAQGYLPPIQVLNNAARGTAYVDINEDWDGTARSYPMVIRFDGRNCVPLFLALADAMLGRPPLILRFDADGVSEIEIGDRRIPVNQDGEMMMHFRGPPGAMPRISVADIIDHRVPAAALAGKAVIIGVTAHALGDRVVTPVGADFPGVEVQATAIDNVLAGDFIYSSEYAQALEKWAAWFMGAAAAIAAAFMTALSSAVVVLLLGAGYLAYVSWELSANGRLVGIVLPFVVLLATYLMIISYRYFAEGREKRYIRSAFELYVHPDYVASLMEDSSMLKLGGERRHLSILFADIMGFTSRAERSEPEPLVALLNTYMTAMTNVIFETGGVVDKLMGDGIMAFWGAPLPVENPARDAINCAIGMISELKKLSERDSRFADIHIGIGIATGDVIVGNFGGEKKFDYSVIGDTVNLASRLEGLTRQFKVNILVNLQTFNEAGRNYVAREIGLVKVKGKDQLVPVVDIAGHQGDGVDPALYQRFGEAIAQMRRGESAEPGLREIQREWPHDHVVEMCLERLHEANGEPLREMVFEFETK